MEGNIAATYTLIHDFLKKQSKIKAANAVKKAAKDIVVLRDDIEPVGPSLDDIVKQWKATQNIRKREESDSSSEESSDDSSSDSGSESSSCSSSNSSSSMVRR
ncbi:hypothetical protein F5I97DRAFT_549418 [Phlebopus sp. FC_14]|nr:hypothetical protein F5I97DRAFT_549418 [Phlebopus sp. FC_14]